MIHLRDQLVARVLAGRLRDRGGHRITTCGLRGFALEPGGQPLEPLCVQERQHDRRINVFGPQGLQRFRHVHIVLQSDQPFRNPRLLGELDQVFPALGLFDLAGTLQQGFQVAEFADQLGRGLDADARHARNIVDAVAGQGLDVHNLLGADAEFLEHLLGADRAILHRVEHVDPVSHQLHQVLVRGHHRDPPAGLMRQPRIGRDDVVGLESVHLDTGGADRSGRLADNRELWDQILGGVRTLSLVLGVDVVPETDPGCIEDYRQMVGLQIVDQPDQHIGEAEHRIDRRSIRPVHRRQRMIGPKNITRTIHQIEMLLTRFSGCGYVLGDVGGHRLGVSVRLEGFEPDFSPRGETNAREDGGAKRDRTADLYNAIVALSQLSYSPLLPCLTCDALIEEHRQNANPVPIRAVPIRCEGCVSQGRHPVQANFCLAAGFLCHRHQPNQICQHQADKMLIDHPYYLSWAIVHRRQ